MKCVFCYLEYFLFYSLSREKLRPLRSNRKGTMVSKRLGYNAYRKQMILWHTLSYFFLHMRSFTVQIDHALNSTWLFWQSCMVGSGSFNSSGHFVSSKTCWNEYAINSIVFIEFLCGSEQKWLKNKRKNENVLASMRITKWLNYLLQQTCWFD